MDLTVVIPVLDEQDSLQELYDELTTVISGEGLSYEIIFIDDGSTDSSWEVISGITAGDDRVRGIRFRRNFGNVLKINTKCIRFLRFES